MLSMRVSSFSIKCCICTITQSTTLPSFICKDL
jgi:hypothetical protein